MAAAPVEVSPTAPRTRLAASGGLAAPVTAVRRRVGMSTERDGGASSAAREPLTAVLPPCLRTALPSMPSGGAYFRLAVHSGKLIAAYLRARRREGRGLAWRRGARREGGRSILMVLSSLFWARRSQWGSERWLSCFVCVQGHLKHT